ncbi:histidine phosphatase superfamily [Dendryphion nanum]|uniref:Histidine phosphatase superfamily n=1 Tax=Dendryphion nanum TaxID=256645 RepID=A0A9P9E2C1_9PLEO|nr:histidine phosphatase superfamily [Dendryphion nanum]
MLALCVATLATSWLLGSTAHALDHHSHGVVAFIRSGERTPNLMKMDPVLTSLGAQQMYQLGNIFRGRFIEGGNGDIRLGEEPIAGLATRLNNDQIFIHAVDAPHIYGSAQAFMQGLYPPSQIGGNSSTGLGDRTGILANNTAIITPLGGYQYPHIQTVGQFDPQSIYISGDQFCPTSIQESISYETTRQYLQTKNVAQSFYQDLPAGLLGNIMQKKNIDYANGMDIYDYVSYQYNHEKTVYDLLNNDNNTLSQLRFYSDEKAWFYWGNTSESSTDADYRAMAGKTLAARILGQFQRIVDNKGNATNGRSQPLTLLFGDHQPMISLFALTLLDQREKNFRALPAFASAMTFELYHTGESAAFPTKKEDLMLRFRFQNGTDFTKGMPAYPMFNNPRSAFDMSWPTFEQMFSRIMVNALADWCGQCASGSLFCWGVDNSTILIQSNSNSSANHKISPTIAGVIGALVTLALAALLFAIAIFVAGIRFHRIPPKYKKSELGGFKGSAKLASDQDLALPKGAAVPAGGGAGIVSFTNGAGDTVYAGPGRKTPHERVNSWELRQKEFGAGGNGEMESPRQSFDAIEETMGKRAVVPHERV